MATPPSLVQLAFANGFDESIEEEILDPSKAFALLENGRQDLRGGYKKRLGFTSLSATRFDGTSRSTGNRLLVHDDLLGIIDGAYLDTYSEAKSVNVTASRVPEASVSVRPLSVLDADNVFDFAACNGYIATAALVQTAVNNIVASVETTDGAVVRSPETIFVATSSITAASLGTYGVYILLVVHDTSTTNVKVYYLDTTSPSTVSAGWVSIGNVITDKLGLSVATIFSLSDRVAIGYTNTSGGASQASVKTFTIAGVVDSAAVNTSSATPVVVTVEGSSSDTLWVAWNESTTLKIKGLTPTSLGTVKANTGTIWTYTTIPVFPPHIISNPSTAGAGRIIGNDGDGTKSRYATFTTSAGTATVGTAGTIVGGYVINRPFVINGRYYITAFPGKSAANLQRVAVISDWTDVTTSPWFRPVANPFPGVVPTVTTNGRGLAHVWMISATSAAVLITVKRSTAAYSPYLVTLDFADITRWQSDSHNGSTFLSGGVLSYFDGRRVSEAAFIHAPELTSGSTGTGLTGTYSYVATYEEVDNDGNWNQSGVSAPVSVTVTNKTITIATTPLVISSRLSSTTDPRVRISLWRTEEGGAAPYHLAATATHLSAGITFSDTMSDVALAVQPLLYGTGNLPGTNGAGQDHRAPPFATRTLSYQGMLLVASGSDVYWSGQTVIGEGTWWNPLFSVPIDGPGAITAMTVMDGTVYVFKERRVYAMSGEAPSDNGVTGGLGVPRRLAIDVGSIDGHTLVTELGIWFRSHRGLELLGRGGGVTWVGEQVQKTMATYPNVTSMVLDEKNSLVRITLAAATANGRASGEGRTLVYDITLQAWVSRDDIRGSTTHEAAQDACVVTLGDEQRYAWLGTDGVVHYERLSSDSSAHLDGSTWVTKRARTPSFKQAGIQGKQQLNRVQILERKATSHDLNVALAYNYDETFQVETTYSAATIDGLLTAGYPITQLRHDPHDDAECEAVSVDITDATPTSGALGTGEGGKWLALSLDITTKPGLFEVPEEAA